MLSPTQNVSVIDVHALAHRQDEAAITRLITTHGCEHLYLDVGSNIGVQIRKLFEPHKYPGAPVHSLFDASFGAAAGGGRCRVCAIGVEPNPRHRSRLGQLQRRLSAAGAGVMIFEAAAGATDGVASLQFGARKSAFEDAGASALGIGRYTGSDEVLVRMLRLSRIVSAARAARSMPPRLRRPPPPPSALMEPAVRAASGLARTAMWLCRTASPPYSAQSQSCSTTLPPCSSCSTRSRIRPTPRGRGTPCWSR